MRDGVPRSDRGTSDDQRHDQPGSSGGRRHRESDHTGIRLDSLKIEDR